MVELPREVHVPLKEEVKVSANSGVTVCMKQVDFSYSDTKPVIADSEFTAAPGETVALIGPSGEGKTTMIRLILGLIRPKNGAVTA